MSIRDDLKAYLDNELPPARMEEVRTAVESDPTLLDELNYLKSIGESIRAQASEPAVVGLEATLARIRNPKMGFWEPIVRRPILTGAAAVLVILVISSLMFPVFMQAKSAAKQFSGFAEKDETATVAKSAQEPYMNRSYMRGDVGSAATAPQASAGKHSWQGESATPNEQLMAPLPSDKELTSDKVRKYAQEKAKSRMVVSNAQMSLKVENAQKAQADAHSLIVGLGGYVENSNSSQLEGQLPTATSVFRVPCTQFDSAIQRLRKLGSVLTESIQADDVTLQYADINARLKVIRIEEQQYLTMLRGARRTGEIMEIRDRLSQVRQQIESMDAQQKALMDQASLSTISVTFEQRVAAGKPETPDSWADETWGSAVNGFSAVGRFLGRLAIILFVYSPLWLGALIVFWIARKRSK